MNVKEATQAVEAAQQKARSASKDMTSLARARRIALEEGYGRNGDVVAALSYLSSIASRQHSDAVREIDAALAALGEAERVYP